MSIPSGTTPHTTLRSTAQTHEEGFELLVYWRTLLKHKTTILGLALALAVLVGVIVFMMTPVYRSTVTLLVEDNKTKVLSIEDVYSSMAQGREQVQTQAEIIKSESLARAVVDKLHLAIHPLYDPKRHESWWNKTMLTLGVGKPPTAQEVQNGVVAAVMANMTVEPVRLSNLIKVSFDSPDRELAALVANTYAQSYIDSDMEAKFRMTKDANIWLNDHLSGLKTKLTESERVLQQYRDQNHIVDAKGLSESGSAEQMKDMMTSLVGAKMQLAQAASAYREIQAAKANGTSLDSLPVVLQDHGVQKLREVVAEDERKVSEMSNRYGPKHIKMIQAQADLQQAKDSLKRQAIDVVNSVEHQYEVARASEAVVAGAVGEIKGTIQNANRKEFQLADLERDVQTNQQVYDMFLQRFKETSASGDLTKAIARVVDPAEPARMPVRPKRGQLIGVALVLGIFLGVGVALLRERLDHTVHSTEEAEIKLGQPILSAVPLLGDKNVARHYLDDPRSHFAESIRTARTGVLLSAIDCPRKVVVVTSSVPGEGKTTIAINLALAQAQTKKVLLIDTDMRRPSVAKCLGLTASLLGLSALVAGEATFEECVQKVPDSDLTVLTAGSIPPNPLELILSDRFKTLMERLSTEYEMIILDSPPLQLVSDAVVLSTLATGLVFVMKSNATPYQVARRCLKVLSNANATLFGVVLNQLDFHRAESYYGGYAGYGTYSKDGSKGYYTQE